MNLAVFENPNGLMSRITQRTKGVAFSAAITDRQLYDTEVRSDHPQRAASGTTADPETDRTRSGTPGGSYR